MENNEQNQEIIPDEIQETQETQEEPTVQTKIRIENYFASYTWGQILLRGILAILLGISALLWPGRLLLALVIVTAAFWLVDGITLLIASFSGEVHGSVKAWFIIRAIIGILAGIAVFFNPVLSTIFIVWFMVIMLAVMTMISGVHEIIMGIKFKNGWLIFGGIIYALFSVTLIFAPLLAAGALVRVIGIFIAIGGIALSVFALKLRSASRG